MYRKIALTAVMLGGVFFIGSGMPEASAATTTTTCTPVLKAQKVKENSMTIKVTCTELKSTKVNVKITLENKDDDDSTKTKTVKVKLSKNGVASIKLTGLDAATNYSLKAKIKKTSGDTYSAYSSSIDATTKGSDYEPEIDKFKNITEDSVRIEFTCDDLEDDAVNVQVAYKKKSSWSTKTYDLTLDSDGEGKVTVDGLKSETTYAFKIRIKKSSDSNYSAYSASKDATTDED